MLRKQQTVASHVKGFILLLWVFYKIVPVIMSFRCILNIKLNNQNPHTLNLVVKTWYVCRRLYFAEYHTESTSSSCV